MGHVLISKLLGSSTTSHDPILMIANEMSNLFSLRNTVNGLYIDKKSPGSHRYYNASSSFAYEQLEHDLYFIYPFLQLRNSV